MTRKVFAHRYKYSHEKRRKQLRRACKDGIVQLIEERPEGFLYAVPEDFGVFGTGRNQRRKETGK